MTEPVSAAGTPPASTGPLGGLRVLDLSRVLAGPWATQILGDLGADVVKIEQPGAGDDTRGWGPPFLEDGSGDAAYFLCANRNKRSVQIDIADPRGAALVRAMALDSDVVIENFRVGALARYGLDHARLRAENPRLVCCSITGFGQDGPYAARGGYDFLIQGMSGLMSVTGRPDDQPGGGPMKAGIPVSDLVTGLYAAIAILAALRHRDATGEGQHIDLALLDAQVALLANQASNWLNGGVVPGRMGNEHPTIVPYQDFACADGDVLVALGNDRQFRAFCALIGRDALADDPRFAGIAGRSANRRLLQAELATAIVGWRADDLIAAMAVRGLPGGRVNTIPEILADPHLAARGLVQRMARADGTIVAVPGFPAKLSATPATYRHAPPRAGADAAAVLAERLGLDGDAVAALVAEGVVGAPR